MSLSRSREATSSIRRISFRDRTSTSFRCTRGSTCRDELDGAGREANGGDHRPNHPRRHSSRTAW